MTREEAEQVFQTIAAIYDLHPERAAEQATVWVPMLTNHDLDVVTPIMLRWIDGAQPERFPHVGAFAAIVRDATRKRDENARPLALTTGDQLLKPVWVVARDLLRARGDQRLLPEQEGGFYQLGLKWPPEGFEILDGPELEQLMVEAAAVPQSAARSVYDRDVDCPICLDTGWVETGCRWYVYRGVKCQGAEQMAPCPGCDKGKLIEHPLDGRGYWGDDGFWRGQQWEPVRAGVVEVHP